MNSPGSGVRIQKGKRSERAARPYEIADAMRALTKPARPALDIDPEMDADARLWGDMLDAEGGNAMDVLDRLVRASIDADDLATSAGQWAAEIGDRKKPLRESARCLPRGGVVTIRAAPHPQARGTGFHRVRSRGDAVRADTGR